VQVLCPMNRGGIGARSLNIELQVGWQRRVRWKAATRNGPADWPYAGPVRHAKGVLALPHR
jgi:hypothetical protein